METPSFDKWKLAAFVALVVAACGAICGTNHYVSSKEAVDDPESRQKLDVALTSLVKQPRELAIQLVPGPAGERLLRHQHEPHLTAVDVLVLGQSDADHMSAEFFRDDVHFYNGFISNSYFAYQYEVYDALSVRGITPALVLWDVRSGFILQGDGTGCEPPLEGAESDPAWFAGPPFRSGVARTTAPWWTQFDSLLSLRQTEHSIEALTAKKAATKPGDESMAVAPFELVPRAGPSSAYRWLADGSRVYPGEVDGKLPPRVAKVPLTEPLGQRKVRPLQAKRFGEYVSRIVKAGSRVIAYAPPIHPDSYADPAQKGPIEAFSAEMQSVLRERNVDFCDFTLEATKLGCGDQDFKDELHLSRACNESIVRALATRAALGRDTLRGLVTRKILAK